jgi:hypothetical protein
LYIHHRNFKENKNQDVPDNIVNSEGSDEIPMEDMSSLPIFSLNDLDEPDSRPSNLSLHNKLLTEEIALDAR